MHQDAAAPDTPDPTHLQAHRNHCADARGALHRLRGTFAAADALIQPRFLSTVAAAALGITLLVLLWLAMAA